MNDDNKTTHNNEVAPSAQPDKPSAAATEKQVKAAADVQINGSDDILENVEADAVLDNMAAAAKDAESFNHGKNDAGQKK